MNDAQAAILKPSIGAFAAWRRVPPAQRLRILIGAVAAFALAAGFAAAGNDFLNDADTLWHIAVGRDIWQTKSFPHVDAYSHTFAGEPWIAKEWLSQLILYGAYALGGWNGVVLTAIVVSLIVFWQLYLALSAHVKPIIAVGAAVGAVAVCTTVFLARPHLIALPFVLLFVYKTWTAAEEGRAPSFWLLAVMCLWANLHGSFTFGYLAAGLAFFRFLYGHRRLRSAGTYRWLAFLILCPAVSIVHPYGFEAAWSTVSIAQSEALPYIIEWRPFSAAKDIVPELTIIALFAAALASGVRINIIAAVFVGFLLHMYFTHMRFIYLLFMLGPALAARDLAARFPALSYEKWAAQFGKSAFEQALAGRSAPGVAAAAVASVAALAAAAHYAAWAPVRTYPIAAINAARDSGLKGNVLNFYSFGGALIFEGVPTFVDGRADRLFQRGFIPDITAARRGDSDMLKAQIAQYDIRWTLLPPDDLRVGMLDGTPGWKRLYADDIAVVHVRDEERR